MVTPDGATPEERGRRAAGRVAAFALAAIVVLVGFLALGSLTASEPEAAPETTTTTTTIGTVPRPSVDPEDFTIADIARGDPLEFDQTASVAGYAIALIEHDDWLYLFSATRPYWELDPGPVEIRRSSDGVVWEELVTIGDSGAQIHQVVATSHGLAAFGADQEVFDVWQSPDGRRWSRTSVEVATDPNESFYPNAFVANDHLMLAAGQVQFDVMSALNRAVADATGESIDSMSLGWDVTGVSDQRELIVRGPLSLPLARIPVDELGLTEEQLDWMTGRVPPRDATVVVSTGGRNWDKGTIEGAQWIESLLAMDDGSIVANGYGIGGPTAWRSFDGMEWEQMNRSSFVTMTERWADRFVAVDERSLTGLMVSEDGETWQETGPSEEFPYQFGWNIYPLGAGESGIAYTAQGFRPGTSAPDSQPEPVTLTRNGLSLSLDLNRDAYELGYPFQGESGMTIWTGVSWSSRTNQLPAGVEIDLAIEQVLISDPATNESLAAFTFEELREAEQSYWDTCCTPQEEPETLVAFVFSPDGEEWTIQDLSSRLGGPHWIQQIDVLADRIVMVVYDGVAYQSPPTGFEIWSAPIP